MKIECNLIAFILTNQFEANSKLVQYAVKTILEDKTRHYHSWHHHIAPMIKQIATIENKEERLILFYAALYHDIVYKVDNKPGQNEVFSAESWLSQAAKEKSITKHVRDKVYEIILATYKHTSTDKLVKEFLKYDLQGLKGPLTRLIEDERLIRKEYQKYDWATYKAGRIEFLTNFAENAIIKEMGASEMVLQEAEWLSTEQPKIAIYPGTFSLFHDGHLDVIKKAEQIFDKVIIVFAENPDKPWSRNPPVPEIIQDRQTEVVRGSLVKWIEALPYPVTIIRGLRNGVDLQYEQNYSYWLNYLSTVPGSIKMVSIFSDKKYEAISSSALRSLMKVDPEAAKKLIYD